MRVVVAAVVAAEGEEVAGAVEADIPARRTQMAGYRLMMSVAESFEG